MVNSMCLAIIQKTMLIMNVVMDTNWLVNLVWIAYTVDIGLDHLVIVLRTILTITANPTLFITINIKETVNILNFKLMIYDIFLYISFLFNSPPTV